MDSVPRVDKIDSFVRGVRSVVGDGPQVLHEPVLGLREKLVVDECLTSGYVSSAGSFVTEFEKSLSAYTGAKFVVATSSGTAALHVSLLVAGVQAGDEVLIPSATFVATANAVSYCGAFPHFVDVERATLGISPQSLHDWLSNIAIRTEQGLTNRLSGRRISACVPMHTFGHPVAVEQLKKVTDGWGLKVVEDASEALGSTRNHRHCGTFGDLGVLSFNGNKIITTGGGGAILTDDPNLASRARHLSTTAKLPHPWEYIHDEVGFNYRMPNLNAALGLAQMERISDLIASKRNLTHLYSLALNDLNLGHIFTEPSECSSNYWLQTFVLNDQHATLKDDLLEAAHASDLHLRPLWRPLHALTPYSKMNRAPLPVTEWLATRLINLPSSPSIA